MRLRLTVQRHSLPPAQILWTAGTLRPPYAAAGASCTISQFLEQVNDIIPLESEDWGLEDYAVEVRGFECLHFAELEQVLKEDDEVCIRPLQTFDLRFRRVSGRHQISADGKHLIDGVAFGRPFLRRADRPAVRIPPRKRRRITYDEEDEDAGAGAGVNDRQLMVRADFDDADRREEISDDEDDDSAVEEESLLGELEDLRNDLQDDVHEDLEGGERALNLDGVEEPLGRSMRLRRRRKTGLGLQGPALIELLDDHGRPYPGEYSNPLLDLYDQDDPIDNHLDARSSKVRKSRRLRNTVQNDENHTKSPKTSSGSASGQASSGSTKSVRFGDAETMTPATVRLDENIEVFDAESFKPQNSAESPLDGSDKENAKPNDEDSDSDESSFIESDSSSVMSTSSGSDNEDTSSSNSLSSSGSDSEDENLPSSRKKSARSPSSSSDSDSSDSEPEKLSSKTAVTNLEKGSCSEGLESKPVAPGHGKTRTQRRNQRRRASKKRAFLVKTGSRPPDATMGAERTKTITEQPEEAVDEPTAEMVDSIAALEAKRKALLASNSTGGGDVTVDMDKDEAPTATEKDIDNLAPDVPVDDTAMADAQIEVQNSQQSPADDVSAGKEAKARQPTGTPEAIAVTEHSVSPNSSKRRAKLDMASSRRLLFGSLGLRAPKTKEDESRLREKLKGDVRPTKDTQTSEELVADSIGDDQSWKDKVILSAVECCQKGIKLSTPPFPFVQRWDPQQQTGYGRRGGRGKPNNKKRKRKSKQYYEEWEEQDTQYDTSQQHELNYYEEEQESGELPVKPKSNAQSQKMPSNEVYETAVNDQLMREAEGISASGPVDAKEIEDLPALPEDMSLCPDLQQEGCTPGAIVAFKQLDMSAETNWQPRISEYKTAIVGQITDDGTLQITLAKRDQPAKEELYDKETGERIYGKFEMPGYEEDDGDDGNGNGNGIVEISFADLIHPKFICAAKPQPDGGRLQQSAKPDGNLEQIDETVMPEETRDLYSSLDKVASSKLDDPMHDSTFEKVNEQVRKEIRDLISDAGWRSSVGSEVLKHGPQPALKPLGSEPQTASSNKHDNNAPDVSSPRFAGFSSSPPPNRPISSHDNLLPDMTGLETDESMLPQTVTETVAATSPRLESLISDKADEDPGVVNNVDNNVVWDDDPSEPISSETNRQNVPKPVSSPQFSSKPVSQSSLGLFSQGKISHKENLSFDGADSDDEFPTLENVLASTRSSFESLVPDDEDCTFTAKSSFESMPSADEDQKRQRGSKSAAKRSIREQSKSLPESCTFKEEDDEDFTPRLSQIPPGTQIVDLTQSSDPVYAPGSNEDDHSYPMPTGPGWVRKTRAGSKQTSPPKGRSFRSRTRSSV